MDIKRFGKVTEVIENKLISKKDIALAQALTNLDSVDAPAGGEQQLPFGERRTTPLALLLT